MFNNIRTIDHQYLDQQYGSQTVGVYSSYRYQGVWAMGTSYMLPNAGTSTGNLYGLAWSHPNTGGEASYLNNHGLLVVLAGSTYAAISGRGWFRDDIMAPIFYDRNDSGYYVDPNGTSRIGGIQIGGASNTSNEIRFRGVNGDAPGSYNHAGIIERLWGTTDQSELLI